MTNDHKDKPQPVGSTALVSLGFDGSLALMCRYARQAPRDRQTITMHFAPDEVERIEHALTERATLSAQLSEARQQSEAEAIAYSSLSAEHERLKAQLSEAQARLAEIEARERGV